MGDKKIELKGNYKIVYQPNGNKTIYSLKNKGVLFLPSDEKLKRRYNEEESKGALSHMLNQYMSRRGILVCGKGNADLGRRALDLESKKVCIEEIQKIVIPFFSNSYKSFLAKKKCEPNLLSEFKRKYHKEYQAANRHYGGVEKILNDIYPNLYKYVHRANNFSRELNVAKLREIFLERFNEGRPINIDYLKRSIEEEERNLFLKLKMLKIDRLDSNLTAPSTKKLVYLTGLSESDILMNGSSRKNLSLLSEWFTTFLLSWDSLLGGNFFGLLPKDKEIFFKNDGMTTFYYGEEVKTGIADLRINNVGGEIKSGAHPTKRDVESYLIKYTPRLNSWKTGEKMSSSFFVFHQPQIARWIYSDLGSVGIQVIGYKEFHSHLEKIVGLIEQEFGAEVKSLRPRIHNLEELVLLHEELSSNPGTFARRLDSNTKIYLRRLLTQITNLSKKIQDEQNGT